MLFSPASHSDKVCDQGSGAVLDACLAFDNDAKTMEAEVIRAEEDVQKAYEDFMKDSNASIQEKTKSEFNKTEQGAKAEEDLIQTTQGPISLRFSFFF